MKRILSVIICGLLLTSMLGCQAAEVDNSTISAIPTYDPAVVMEPEDVEVLNATIEVEGFGDIVLELYPSKAPETVCNFVSLARNGFYDGRIFHRVMKGFMIQGGSSDGLGYVGSDHRIKGEFKNNGFENDIKHVRGVISMARTSQSYDSASSQFFIVHGTSSHLDGDYAAFGKVTAGMDVVDAIANVDVSNTNKPYEDVVIKTITITGPQLREPNTID